MPPPLLHPYAIEEARRAGYRRAPGDPTPRNRTNPQEATRLRLITLVAALALAGGWQLTARAATEPPLPDLPRLVLPSGRNGYEEFIAAAELIINHPRFNEAWFPGSTLAQKRRALAETPV